MVYPAKLDPEQVQLAFRVNEGRLLRIHDRHGRRLWRQRHALGHRAHRVEPVVG